MADTDSRAILHQSTHKYQRLIALQSYFYLQPATNNIDNLSSWHTNSFPPCQSSISLLFLKWRDHLRTSSENQAAGEWGCSNLVMDLGRLKWMTMYQDFKQVFCLIEYLYAFDISIELLLILLGYYYMKMCIDIVLEVFL